MARGFGAGPILLGSLFVLSSALYLFLVNGNAVRGADVNGIDRTTTQLRIEQEELRIELARARSQQKIDDVIEQFTLTQVGEAEIIETHKTIALE